MKIDVIKDEVIKDPYFEIIGVGEIGDKARQLKDKTQKLVELGFEVPKRTILAEDFFDEFFQINGLGANLREVNQSEDIEEAIKNGNFLPEQLQIIQQVCDSYGTDPLVIRSSAVGDARGTGTYRSEFSVNDLGQVCAGIKEVLASYFSKSAILFRHDAGLQEGFGIIIEPIIGNGFDDEIGRIVMPILSGFAYTRTGYRRRGYVSIVRGLGCAVSSGEAELITRETLDAYNGSLNEYIWSQQSALSSRQVPSRNSSLLETVAYGFNQPEPSGFWISTDNIYGGIGNTKVGYSSEISSAMNDLNLVDFFNKMEIMEKSFGKPQYIEWAMTVEEGVAKFWIIQIADVDPANDVEFRDFGEILLTGHTVTGNGIMQASKVIFVKNSSELPALQQFNELNEGYILIAHGDLLSRIRKPLEINQKGKVGESNISYEYLNNAGAVLEIGNVLHIANPGNHLSTQFRQTKKLFAVVDGESQKASFVRDINKSNGNYNSSNMYNRQDVFGVVVYGGQFVVVCSEKNDTLVLHAKRDEDKE